MHSVYLCTVILQYFVLLNLIFVNRYDYVEVFDGNSAEGKLLGRYCGNEVRHLG